MTNSPAPNLKNRNTENFPVGSFLIRPNLRTHVHAFYNFARAADDISDDPLMSPQEKVHKLNRFAAVLGDDNAEDIPEAAAMRRSLRETRISPQHCLDLLAAFKRDAFQLRYRDWNDLMDYCRYSASPVGRYVLALHNIGATAWAANDALCSALQVINHIQDCYDDYREMDRVYIPHDMMALQGASCSDLSRTELTKEMRATLDTMLDKVEQLMIVARSFPRQIPDTRLKCEVAVIITLADKITALLRVRDPLKDDVKLGKCSTATAVIQGVLRAWS